MAVYNNLVWLLCAVIIFSKVQCKSITKKDNNKKRCGVKDEDIPIHSRFRRSTVVDGHWNKTTITYNVLNGPYEMSWQSEPVTLTKARVQELVDEAFAEWAPHCGLKFVPWTASEPRADIVLSFERKDHGDGDSFDGPGSTLAHADYPWASGSDVHFDNDETWVDENDPRANVDDSVTIFYPIALHEIGHTLGLRHSYDSDTIMYGSENEHVKHLALADKQRMRSLYGITGDIDSTTTTTTTTTTTEPPTTTRTESTTTEKLPNSIRTEHSTTEMLLNSTRTEHSTTEMLPNSTRTEHSTTEMLPNSTRTEHSTTEMLPNSTRTEHSTTEMLPNSTRTEYSTTEMLPNSTRTETSTIEWFPNSTRTENSTTERLPNSTRTETTTTEKDFYLSTTNAVIEPSTAETLEEDLGFSTAYVPKYVLTHRQYSFLQREYPLVLRQLLLIESNSQTTTTEPTTTTTQRPPTIQTRWPWEDEIPIDIQLTTYQLIPRQTYYYQLTQRQNLPRPRNYPLLTRQNLPQ